MKTPEYSEKRPAQPPAQNAGSLHPGDGRLAELKRTADIAWQRDKALTERLNALRRERDANRRIAWEMTRAYQAAPESPIVPSSATREEKP